MTQPGRPAVYWRTWYRDRATGPSAKRTGHFPLLGYDAAVTRPARWLFVLALASSACLLAAPALPQSADDAERSRRLFEDGQKAMAAQDFATACASFEESYKISGVPGALLNWADCEESRNRLATALGLWQQ